MKVADLKCPKCGSIEEFEIRTYTWMRIHPGDQRLNEIDSVGCIEEPSPPHVLYCMECGETFKITKELEDLALAI